MSSATEWWCPACREVTALGDRGVCVWCDGPLEERRRRGGWKRPDRVRKLDETQLRALHHAHLRGQSINQLAKQVYERVGYASHGSCATAISKGWQQLGLPARDRIAATQLASTKHGRKRRKLSPSEEQAYRRWMRDQRGWRALNGPGQEQCGATKRQPPRKGRRCQHHAMEGSKFCVSHDPQRELARQAHLANMRRRIPRRDMVPLAPLAAWLEGRRSELGTLKAVAESVGKSSTEVLRLIAMEGPQRKPKTTIGRDLVIAMLERDGSTSFAELYPEQLEAAA